ncbi:MAG: hypothetical protein KDC66_12885 [Phaeodactylibacter sp.]|nr:hypothetical protein [Phaeodactylibacter sp.]MCB9275913.1 hypothetical protein [Lewinellaceae bacterium]
MKHLLPTFFVLICLNAFAQNGALPAAGARGIAMGQAGVAFEDVNSLFGNQAGLASLETVSGLAFAERRFLLEELQSFSFGAAYPTSSGTFGLSLNYFGFEAYNEQRIGLAYGRRLFNRFAIGAQFLMLNTRIPDYGNKAAFTFELGALAELTPGLNLGVHIFSPARVEIADNAYLPTVLKIGLSYLPSDKLSLLAEVEKDIDYAARTKVGVEYYIAEPLALRLGVATRPTEISFGLGYRLANGLSLDIASRYHQVLGFTPAAGVSYGFGQKRGE